MFEWIVSAGAKAIFKIFGDSIVKPILEVWAKKQDIDLEKFKTQTDERKTVNLAIIASEVERIKGSNAIIQEGMNHPVWWWAWALFVIPVGFYHAAIFVLSTFGIPPTTFKVLQVPPMQEQWAMWIVLSIFGAQVASGIVTTITNKLNR